jgi:phosphate/sulfate permease
MPVSTTQTIVGALIGVGFATQAGVTWGWESGSVSQVAASWAIAPLIACGFSAVIFGSVKYLVLERKDSFKWGMRMIPFYFALTSAILALFIVVEAPTAPSLEEFGGGKAAGIVLGVFFGVLALTYIFFMPFLKRKLIHKDARLRIWHVPLGPLLSRENPPLYWPGKGDEYVKDYYADGHGEVRAKGQELRQRKATGAADEEVVGNAESITKKTSPDGSNGDIPTDPEKQQVHDTHDGPQLSRKRKPEPYERWIVPAKELSWLNPQRHWAYLKFTLLQGKFLMRLG